MSAHPDAPSNEALVVVIWALASYMTGEQIERACDAISELPVIEQEGVRKLVLVLREASAE